MRVCACFMIMQRIFLRACAPPLIRTPLPGLGLPDRHIPWISCLLQSTQYLFLARRFLACSSSLHFPIGIPAFTTSPHMGQLRTGTLRRL